VNKPSVKTVGFIWRKSSDDQDGHDEAVDSDDTGHDDGDEGLKGRGRELVSTRIAGRDNCEKREGNGGNPLVLADVFVLEGSEQAAPPLYLV
jgi:hypothetical protein